MITYAYQLLDDAPANFERALTIDGLMSHGRKRFPNEWDAILADETARARLHDIYFVQPRPDDGMRWRMATLLSAGGLEAVASR